MRNLGYHHGGSWGVGYPYWPYGWQAPGGSQASQDALGKVAAAIQADPRLTAKERSLMIKRMMGMI